MAVRREGHPCVPCPRYVQYDENDEPVVGTSISEDEYSAIEPPDDAMYSACQGTVAIRVTHDTGDYWNPPETDVEIDPCTHCQYDEWDDDEEAYLRRWARDND